MISDFGTDDHARNHANSANQHLSAASEHLDSLMDNLGLTQMAGAHHSNAGQEIGAAVAQHHMARKHIASLIGRPGWDGTSDFQDVSKSNSEMGHHIKMAGTHHASLGEAMHDGDKDSMAKSHAILRGHLDNAVSAGKTRSTPSVVRLRRTAVSGPTKKPKRSRPRASSSPSSRT